MITAIVQHYEVKPPSTPGGPSSIQAAVIVGDGITYYLLNVGGIPAGTPDVQAYVTERQDYYWSIAPSQGAPLVDIKTQAKRRVTSWEPSDVLSRNVMRTTFAHQATLLAKVNELVAAFNAAHGTGIAPLPPYDWPTTLIDARARIDTEADATAGTAGV